MAYGSGGLNWHGVSIFSFVQLDFTCTNLIELSGI